MTYVNVYLTFVFTFTFMYSSIYFKIIYIVKDFCSTVGRTVGCYVRKQKMHVDSCLLLSTKDLMCNFQILIFSHFQYI